MQEPSSVRQSVNLRSGTMPNNYVPTRLPQRIERRDYEFMGFSGEDSLTVGKEVGTCNLLL